jgi:CubicO group peptidase (beta-lactamase class C family)
VEDPTIPRVARNSRPPPGPGRRERRGRLDNNGEVTPGWREAVDQVVRETDFSGVVHVSRSGRLLHEQAAGLADRAHGVTNTVDTQFALAIGSKGFTALAVMALVADGALSLDTTVRGVLGDELPLVDAAVTVGQLLAHTSGVGDYLDEPGDVDEYVLPVPVHRLARTADYLSVLAGHPMRFVPGERFEYCNSGFVILALLVEAATGRTFHEVVADRVCAPADLSATAYLRSDQLPGSAAIGYVATEDGWRTNQFHLPVRGSGDGGAYSTARDFVAFWAALFAGRILPMSLVDEMVRPRSEVRPGLHYGLGFWLRPELATVMLEGSDAGVSFRTAYEPGSGLLYTVVSNTTGGAWPVARLLDELVPDLARC